MMKNRKQVVQELINREIGKTMLIWVRKGEDVPGVVLTADEVKAHERRSGLVFKFDGDETNPDKVPILMNGEDFKVKYLIQNR